MKILQFDLECNLIKIYNSTKEASEELKISSHNILRVVRKERHTAGGFLFINENMQYPDRPFLHGNWKNIAGYESYKISDKGEIYSMITNSILKPMDHCNKNNVNKYKYVSLIRNNKPKHKYVHRLVAEAFIPNPENKRTVNHIDGDKSNNNIINLEWNTYKENVQHAINTGLIKPRNEFVYSKARSVNQYDMDGNFIMNHAGIRDAERSIGKTSTNICNCCQGKYSQSHGFIWKYA